jgi:hypothetical protein
MQVYQQGRFGCWHIPLCFLVIQAYFCMRGFPPPCALSSICSASRGMHRAASLHARCWLTTACAVGAGSKFRARPAATFASQAELRRALTGLGHRFHEGASAAELELWYHTVRRFDTLDDGRVNLSEFWAVVADSIFPGVRAQCTHYPVS